MEFRVSCECGEVLSVTEGSAGQKLPCRCGRIVAIPRFRELQALAGAGPQLAPDFVIEQLLLAGKLPDQDCCLFCGTPTNEVVHVVVECERAQVGQTGRSLLWYVGVYLLFPLAAILTRAAEGPSQSTERGRDKIYSLPLRLCLECRENMTASRTTRDILHLVPIYHRLLLKYPKAIVRDPD
jgi:hypothetical protein